MKICLVVDDYMPNSIKVAAKMMHELAIEFKKQGHQVMVLTPNQDITKQNDIIFLDDIKICRFKSGQIKNVNKIKRVINESLLSYNAWKFCKDIIKEEKYDLVVYYSPTIFFGPLIKNLKKEWKTKTYLILRDIFPQWTIDNGLIKEKSIITKYFKFFESINYNQADKIGLMSEENLKWFKNNYPQFDNLELLYNWASNDQSLEKSNYREKLNLKDKVIFFYGGNMGHAQDMMNLIRLAKNMLTNPQAHFLFVGAGDEVSLIKENIDKFKLSNVTILDSVTQAEFKKILSIIDIGLFTLNVNHKTHNFPGKLLGYMCESKVILGSINPGNDLKEVIESNNAGFISVNGEDDILYENAKKLLDIEIRKEKGKSSNALLNKYFTVESISKQILKSIS